MISESPAQHEQHGNQHDKLSGVLIRELTRLNPLISLGHVLYEWSVILAAIWFFEYLAYPPLYILVVMFIGARMHALGFLLHDASHYRLLPSKRWNDWLADLFLAFPLFITVRNYRKTHLTHHRFLNTDKDPDWVAKQSPDWEFPKTRWQMLRFLLKPSSTAKSELHWAGRNRNKQPPTLLAARIVFYIAIILLLSVLGLWQYFAMYWLAPMFLWWPIAMRMCSMAEHFGISYSNAYSKSRTVIPSLFDSIFISPKNAGYHLDHHLYPGVPFYRLPQLHQALMEFSAYRENAHVTKGYLNVLRECTRGKA